MVSHLVYVTRGDDVRTTIVNGRVLWRDGRLLSLDERAMVAVPEPADDARGDLRADPLDGEQVLLGRRGDGIEGTERVGERPGDGRPDVADVQPDEETPEVSPLRRLDRGEEVRDLPVLEAGHLGETFGGEGVDVAGVADEPEFEQRLAGLLTEPLDVHRPSAREGLEPFEVLGRTCPHVRAPPRGRALLADERRPAGRTGRDRKSTRLNSSH